MVRASTLASRDKWVVSLIFIFYGCGSALADIFSIWNDRDLVQERSSGVEYQTLNTSKWWDAAQGCEEFGGQLYVPGSEDIPQDLMDALDEDELYWVGAVKNSKWIWTSDSSPLYTYVGYKPTPDMEKTLIHGNSAFQCHLQCDDDNTVGLRGEECYCLTTAVATPTTNTSQIRCAGNFDQWCGNEDGISLYQIVLDNTDIVLHADGECVYAKKEWRRRISLHLDENCDSERSLACEAPLQDKSRCRRTVCVKHDDKTWDQSNRTQPLLKVNDANRGHLYDAMDRRHRYWIGLRRMYFWKLINGLDVSSTLDDDSGLLEACLTVRKVGDELSPSVSFAWSPCEEKLQPLCESAKLGRTYIPEPPPSTAQPTTSTGTNQTELFGENTGNPGGYIGAVIGCVAVLICCIVLVLFIRRKRIFCFAKKSDTQTTATTFLNPAAGSTTYSLATSTDPYYSMPNPSNDQLPDPFVDRSILKQQTSDPYYSTPALQEKPSLPLAVVMPYRPLEQSLYVNSPKIAKEGDYNSFSDTEKLNSETPGNAYSHALGLLNNSYKGEYDTAKSVGTDDENKGTQDQKEEGDGVYDIADETEHQMADGEYDKANILRNNLALTGSNASQTSVASYEDLVEPSHDFQACTPAQSVAEGGDGDFYEIPVGGEYDIADGTQNISSGVPQRVSPGTSLYSIADIVTDSGEKHTLHDKDIRIGAMQPGTGHTSKIPNQGIPDTNNVEETDIYECIDYTNPDHIDGGEDKNAVTEGEGSAWQHGSETANMSTSEDAEEDREHIYGNMEEVSGSGTAGSSQDGHCYYNIVSDTNALSTLPSTQGNGGDNVYSLATDALA
ncbi:uncharacterized protein LOC124111941 [Haliotis rufescens]|uniref:uncharacterized protein LOC124111941 n=1 Tax=Haliotis rufescens TaxID=6454 RepID=UPI00201F8751|nr:uncharacterized protein LOC124111941 [Haliotis rufescens]